MTDITIAMQPELEYDTHRELVQRIQDALEPFIGESTEDYTLKYRVMATLQKLLTDELNKQLYVAHTETEEGDLTIYLAYDGMTKKYIPLDFEKPFPVEKVVEEIPEEPIPVQPVIKELKRVDMKVVCSGKLMEEYPELEDELIMELENYLYAGEDVLVLEVYSRLREFVSRFTGRIINGRYDRSTKTFYF